MRAILPRLIKQGVRVHSIITDPPYHLQSITKRFGAILVEREPQYVEDIKRRFAALKREKFTTEGK